MSGFAPPPKNEEPKDDLQKAYDLIAEVRDDKNWKVHRKEGANDPFDVTFEWVGEINPDLWLSLAQSELDMFRQRSCIMHHRFFIGRHIYNKVESYAARAILYSGKWAGPEGTYVDWDEAMRFETEQAAKDYIDTFFKEKKDD